MHEISGQHRSRTLNCPLTLSHHYIDAKIQINTYNHNAPINVFSEKGSGGDTLGLDQQKSLPWELDRTL